MEVQPHEQQRVTSHGDVPPDQRVPTDQLVTLPYKPQPLKISFRMANPSNYQILLRLKSLMKRPKK